MHQYNVCCQDAWYILSGLDIQLEQSENKNPALRNLVEGPMKVENWGVVCVGSKKLIESKFEISATELRVQVAGCRMMVDG